MKILSVAVVLVAALFSAEAMAQQPCPGRVCFQVPQMYQLQPMQPQSASVIYTRRLGLFGMRGMVQYRFQYGPPQQPQQPSAIGWYRRVGQ